MSRRVTAASSRPARQQPGRDPRRGGLGGTGLVADDLYLMAHDENTGRALLRRRALGIGLAGGLLAELLLAGCITVRRDGALAPGGAAPGDGLAGEVLGQVAGEREPHLVQEWLLFLARSAAPSGRSADLTGPGGPASPR